MPPSTRAALTTFALVAGSLLVSSPLARPARAATPDQVEAAIVKAKAHLLGALQKDNWEGTEPRRRARNVHEGGLTALAAYALLAAGESPQDARLAPVIQYLKAVDMNGIYALGLRCQVWNLVPQKPDILAAMKKDAALLLQGAHAAPDGGGKAFFRYTTRSVDFDHSASQYGVLGLWALAEQGVEVPTSFWQSVDAGWRKHQLPDGAWGYTLEKDSPRASMTAAGIATLFISQQYVHFNEGVNCTGNVQDANIDRGLKWMSDHFEQIINRGERRAAAPGPGGAAPPGAVGPAMRAAVGGQLLYTLYGVERIGVASGYKYFGTTDWYQEGADLLVRTQGADGSWGPIHDTAFGILFLVRGRAPVVLNKLQYEIDQHGDKPKPANWNQRPRDAANLVHWMSKQLERDLNWQIVNLKVPVEELHDAPLLYLAGNQSLDFTQAERNKLKLYVEQGGLIVGNADCGSQKFSESFKKLGTQLFGYEFRELPADHVIYTHEQYARDKWHLRPSVLGLSNGARELMVLIPALDPPRFWQVRAYGGHEETHQLLDDLFLYACEKKNLRYKGDTYLLGRSATPAKASIKVARLQYGGNWNPEPGGWRRLAIRMHNHGTDLVAEPVTLGEGKLTTAYPAAHLTGTAAFSLTPAARDELRKYVEAGGTLILDACGGGGDFTLSVQTELGAILPGAIAEALPAAHPAFTFGGKAFDVRWRPYAIGKAVAAGSLRGPRVKGIEVKGGTNGGANGGANGAVKTEAKGEGKAGAGRVAVFVSDEDLSVGLVGQPVDGIVGYTPQSATDLMEGMLLYAAGGTKAEGKPPTTKPAVAGK